MKRARLLCDGRRLRLGATRHAVRGSRETGTNWGLQHEALDLRETRRAREPWLREVSKDLRAGVVSRALDILREKGAVREYATHEEAREALVRSWAKTTRGGQSTLLVATRNDDVQAMNEQARGVAGAAGRGAPTFVLPAAFRSR